MYEVFAILPSYMQFVCVFLRGNQYPYALFWGILSFSKFVLCRDERYNGQCTEQFHSLRVRHFQKNRGKSNHK